MNKEDIQKEILNMNYNSLCLNLGTGAGKSKCALDYAYKFNPKNILIVVPTNVLKDNWKMEIHKWNYTYKFNVEYSTYVGLNKFVDRVFDCVILDECHHLSQRSRDFLEEVKFKRSIFLSATIPVEIQNYIKHKFNTYFYRKDITELIDDGILPQPELYLMPLELDDKNKNQKFNLYGKKIIDCTAKEWNNRQSDKINFYKKKFLETKNIKVKNCWLLECKNRLTFLAKQKTMLAKQFIERMNNKNKRTIVFCANIEQSENLNIPSINSKNVKSDYNLGRFNNKKIDMISAINMLNEGVTLSDCECALFIYLAASDLITTQRIGRTLRHKYPKIFILYFKNTREEEIVDNIKKLSNTENTIIKIIDLKKNGFNL